MRERERERESKEEFTLPLLTESEFRGKKCIQQTYKKIIEELIKFVKYLIQTFLNKPFMNI